jgi:copper homeostasis protein
MGEPRVTADRENACENVRENARADAPLPLVEACCDSVWNARLAEQHGAGRVELCGPGPGGTTPTLGLMARVRDELRVPLHAMIRPHTRDFVYDDDDLDVMRGDIIAARGLGIDGVVVGPLQVDGSIDARQLADLVELARPMRVTFHRAFDAVVDPLRSLEVLLQVGVHYVLTSGQARTARDGAAQLAALQARAGDRLTVLAGGGIRGDHVQALLAQAPLREVHARGVEPTIIRDLVSALRHGASPIVLPT